AVQAQALPPLPEDGVARRLGLANAAKESLRAFLRHYSTNAERALFLRCAQRLLPPSQRVVITAVRFLVDVLAFTDGELISALQLQHSSHAERSFFLRSAQRLLPPSQRDEITADHFLVVVPAFTVSELTAAFQIGFLIFLPFLVIDMVVANILLALGMMMLSPTTISLPFKLLLFVLIDGWAKLVHGLVLTYGT